MSDARDYLMATAFRAANRGAYEGLADEMRRHMDAYTHELAEQVRAAAEPPEGHEWTVWNGGMEDAADLIDPEVAT